MENDRTTTGQPPGADAEQLREFLASAPAGLQSWAQQQLATLEPTDDPPNASQAPEPAVVGIEAFPEFADDTPPVRRPTGTGARATRQVAGGVGRVNLILVALLAAAVVIIVQQMGLSSGTDSATMQDAAGAIPSTSSEFAPLDEARVAELEAQIEASPTDAKLRGDLGQLYFESGLYQDAVGHFEQALELAPDDSEVLLSLGVAEYSLNDYDAAEQHWLRATEVAPELPEPWYNLGFLYLAQTPPDYVAVENAWAKVVEVAPDSELAQTAAAHLERFKASTSSPTPGG